MTQLGPDKVGEFLRQQAGELQRIWRMARASFRPEVFPGLLDDVIARFFERAGELLAQGGPPEEVWTGLSGVVRWPPSGAPAELTREWTLLGDVLSATGESVNASPQVKEWLTRAVTAAEAGTAALRGGHGARPPGIVPMLMFSASRPKLRPAEGEDTA